MDPDELESLTCSDIISLIVDFFEASADDRDPDLLDDCVDWFLFAYSPETNFASFQANEEFVKNEQFVEVILTKLRDLYQPEIFLEAVNLLSSVGEFFFCWVLIQSWLSGYFCSLFGDLVVPGYELFSDIAVFPFR